MRQYFGYEQPLAHLCHHVHNLQRLEARPWFTTGEKLPEDNTKRIPGGANGVKGLRLQVEFFARQKQDRDKQDSRHKVTQCQCGRSHVNALVKLLAPQQLWCHPGRCAGVGVRCFDLRHKSFHTS